MSTLVSRGQRRVPLGQKDNSSSAESVDREEEKKLNGFKKKTVALEVTERSCKKYSRWVGNTIGKAM